MFSYSFYYRIGAGVPYGKTFSCNTAYKYFSAGGSVKSYVTGDHIILGRVFPVLRRIQDQLSAGKSFAVIIVGISFQFQSQTFRDKGAEALSAGPLTVYSQGVFRQSVFMLSGDLCTQNGAESPVCVADFHRYRSFFSFFQGRSKFLQKYFLVQGLLQLEVVYIRRVKGYLFSFFCKRIFQNSAKIDLSSHWILGFIFYFQKVASSYHLVNGTDAQFRHIFTEFLSDKSHKVYYIFRFSGKAFPKFRILGCHANRAGIQVADSHHHTAHRYQRRSGKAEFLCSQKGGDSHVSSAHELTVCLNHHTASQTIHQQGLMGLCQSQLPGQSCVVDGAFRSCAGTSVISGDQDNLGACFGNAGSYGSHTCLRNKFYGNTCIFIGIFQVIDQLGQILDRINIVMWRRRDQAYPGG